MNTWTYGFISAAAEQVYSFAFDCDFDNDGVADKDDKDDDNDGIPDTAESYGIDPQTQTSNGAIRTDGTGVLVYLDASYVIASGNRAWRDTNADGINDYFDLDLDGVPNHLDVDSDGDGLTDAIEANKGVAPLNYVAASGRINSPVGANGMPSSAETNDGTSPASSLPSANLDSDGDGVVDRFDRDSDNDGIPDLIEAQSSVAAPASGTFAALAGNGLAYRAPSGTDADGDGLDDSFDTSNGGTAILYAWNTGTAPNSTPATAPTLPDYLDLDSDNDGLTDAVESNQGVLPAGMSSSGRYISITDVDRDGLQDNLVAYVSADQDGDVIPNFRDLDSDNDAIPDMLEANGGVLPANANYNGRVSAPFAGTNDTDNDGLINQFDTDNGGTALANGNLDGDRLPNFLDSDSDGDGLSDMREANLGNLFSNDETTVVNPDGRFRFGYVQANDDDRDGLANDVDPNFATAYGTPAANLNRITLDTDGDGRVDYLDLDSDNDGITDLREGPTTNAYRLPSGIDTDGDGLDNAFDNNQTSTIRPDDSDGVEVNGYDYRDINSDNDRFADWTEGFDDNHDGKALDDIKAKAVAWTTANPAKSGYYPLAGVPADQGPTWMFDADNDGTPNFLDPQSSFFRDDNANGLADLYDPAYGGSPSSAPRRTPTQANADFRFQGQQTPLPVELISFQAKAAGRNALVTWATASEKNNARFLVERSADASTFVVAGTVEGKGTTSRRADYSFTDKNVGTSAGTHYYRLRQVDQDGKESVSEVRVVSFDGTGAAVAISVYPSPAADNATLDLLALPTATYGVEILAADGRLMTRFEAQGGHELALPVAGYAKGTYLVRVSGQGQNYLVKLLKN